MHWQVMEFFMKESHMYLLDNKSSPSVTGQNNNRTTTEQQKDLFKHFKYCWQKNNLEAQIPRGDTSIPSVSAGLYYTCHMSHITNLMPNITCHISHVSCHTCHTCQKLHGIRNVEHSARNIWPDLSPTSMHYHPVLLGTNSTSCRGLWSFYGVFLRGLFILFVCSVVKLFIFLDSKCLF